MARWNQRQEEIHMRFSKGLMALFSESKIKSYEELAGIMGCGVASAYGLITGSVAARIDHVPGLFKAFGSPVLKLVNEIAKEEP